MNFIRRRLFFLLLLLSATLFVINACGHKLVITRPQLRETTEIRVPMHNRQGKFFNWKNVNIQGMGYVTGLVINPVSPYDVYIRTDIGGAYKFDRKNHQWLPLLDMFDTSFAGGGVGVESIAVDPNASHRVYVATSHWNSTFKAGEKTKYKYSGEVIVSDNQGKTWKLTGLNKHNVYVGANNEYRSDTGERLAVDPNKPDLIYFASRRDGLWKKDGNQDWTRVLGGLPDPGTLPNYKNADGSNNNDMPGFTFVTFDKSTGALNQPTKTIYLGVHGSGVWRSTDGGVSWNNIAGSDNPLRGVLADSTFYTSFGTKAANGKNNSGSVRKYQDGKWYDITPDGTERIYSAIAVQLDQPNTIMAISDRNVYRSNDGGNHWNRQIMYMGAYDANNPKDPINQSAPPYYESFAGTGAASIVIDPSNPKQVWWTNGWGVARTDDVTIGTPYYQWLMNNLEELDVNLVRIPPKPKAEGGADLLSATQDMIGFRHGDRTKIPSGKINPFNIPVNPAFKWANPQWNVYPQPFPHVAGATSMDYSYNHPDYAAFVGFHQWQNWSVYGMTHDNGQSWQAFKSIPKESFWKSDKSGQEEVLAMAGQIAMSPTNPQNMVWVPTWGPWPHYTTDGGKTWNLAKNLDHDPKPNPYDPQNNDHIHYDALPKSWPNTISPWVSSHILAADRKDPQGQTFYYYDGWTFYYSSDGGANWNKGASKVFPAWIVHPTIVPNPTKMGDIWMSFSRNYDEVDRYKLYHSRDGGKTFHPVSSVDTCEFVSFGKGKQQPYIYIFGRVAGATKEAMYKSEDMGNTWIQISDPNVLQFPGISHLEADMRTPNLVYVALQGRGIMVGEF